MKRVKRFALCSCSWTQIPLSAVNTFGFGRLSWAPRLDATALLREWAEVGLAGSTANAIDAVVAMLAASWPAYENFTASLGWGFVCASNHYNMDPASRTDYTNASRTRVGYSRGQPGAYASAYNGAAAVAFLSLAECPEQLLLSFFNVEYSYQLQGPEYGGLSVLEWIYASHAAGAATSAAFLQQWRALKGQVDLSSYAVGGTTEDDVFDSVADILQAGAADAESFSASVTGYFQQLVGNSSSS